MIGLQATNIHAARLVISENRPDGCLTAFDGSAIAGGLACAVGWSLMCLIEH